MRFSRRLALASTILVLAALNTSFSTADAKPNTAPVDAWTTGAAYLGGPYTDKTVRDIVHTSIGGSGLQLRLSNAAGTVPVTFDDVWIGAQSAGAGIKPGTNHRVLFGGLSSITVPVGADVLSDPVDLTATAFENLSVSIHVAGDTGNVTGHIEAQQDGWYSDGDTASDPSASTYVNPVQWWFWLDAILVKPAKTAKTVVALGDSITEGYQSTLDANHRYPDYLAARLARSGKFAVANEGIGGNRITQDGGLAGVNVQARLDRDVLSQPNVSTVIYTEGINDIGNANVTSATQLIQADQQIISRLHLAGIRVLGGTLLPYQGAGYYSAAGEQIREHLNQWIRTSGAFDGVVDFDAATRDAANPQVLQAKYDSGDHLHPNDAGYQAMANAVPLNLL